MEIFDFNYFIIEWVWFLIERDCVIDVIDFRICVIRNYYFSMMMKRYLMVVMLCVYVMVFMWLIMCEVLCMLEGYFEVLFVFVLECFFLFLFCKVFDFVKLGYYEVLEWLVSYKNVLS